MPVVIPMTPDGARRCSVEIAGQTLMFRTQYSVGEQPLWLLDIYSYEEEPLITGLALVPGSNNIIKGHGDVLADFQLYVLAMDDNYTDPLALGNSVHLILYLPGEDNIYSPPDPMLSLGRTIST